MHVRPEIREAGSKTSYDVDYQALIPIQQFAHQKNIAVLMVTHTRKAIDAENPFNQIQGSTGIQAGCDNLMMLTKDDNICSLHVRGRRVPEAEYALELLEGGTWKMIAGMQDYKELTATDESYENPKCASGCKRSDIANGNRGNP